MGRRAATASTWLMALVLVGAGCGGGAGTAGNATPAPANATPAATAAGSPTETAAEPAGAETAEPGGGSTTDVCALLTVDEIRSATGIATRAVPSTTPQFEGAAGDCEWFNEGGTTVVHVTLGNAASLATASTTATAFLDATRAEFDPENGAPFDELSGVGDAAIYWDPGMMAIKGGSVIELYAPDLEKDQLVALAKAILARI